MMVVMLVYVNVFKLSASILSTIDLWRVVFGTWKQMGRWNPDARSGGRDAFFRAVIGSCVTAVFKIVVTPEHFYTQAGLK